MNNQKGFTLVEVIMVAGLLGALALGAMRLLQNVSHIKSTMNNAADEVHINNTVQLITSDRRHCRLSLAGDGPIGSPTSPVTFKKESIDEDTEGLDIELYLSNQAGDTRQKISMSSTDTSVNQFGKIKILDMKLRMDNGTGFDYTTSAYHQDVGNIVVTYEKNIDGSRRSIVKNFPVNVSLKTDGSGNSTILGCQLTSAGGSAGSFEGSDLLTFSLDMSTPSQIIDLTSYADAKFLFISGRCNCSSSSGNMYMNAIFSHSDGTTKTYELCMSSQDGHRFPASSSLPISPSHTQVILSLTSTCGGSSYLNGALLK